MSLSNASRPVILITGCAGLIGSRLAADLSRDFQIVGLDVKPPDEPDAMAWIECDLTQAASVAAALDTVAQQFGPRWASVLHLAAYYDFKGEPSELYDELTVKGTARLLRELQRYEVEQFVFSSSLLVMESVDESEKLTEHSPTDAAWAYPESKLRAEKVIEDQRGAISAVVLRIAGVYDEDGHSLPIGQQILRIHEKQLESYFFPGDVDHGQAFVHLDDLVDCFRAAVEQRHHLSPFEMFLVAEPDVMSYAELQEEIGEQLHGQEWPAIRIPKIFAKAGAWVKDKLSSEEDESFIKPWMVDLADAHYPVSIAKAQHQLHWSPRHRLRTTLPEMLRRLKANPHRWYAENGLPLPGHLK